MGLWSKIKRYKSRRHTQAVSEQQKKEELQIRADAAADAGVKDKRIAYQYMFRYSGKEQYDGQKIYGAGITLNITPYKFDKNDRHEEILFAENEEPYVKIHEDYVDEYMRMNEYMRPECKSINDVHADEFHMKKFDLSNVFNVSFNRDGEQGYFHINKIHYLERFFNRIYSWYTIEVKPIKYYLWIAPGKASDKIVNFPAEFRDLPFLQSVEVSEQEFNLFLKSHVEGFDLPENKFAAVTGVMFYNIPDTTYIIDHYRAKCHKNYCRVVQIDSSRFNVTDVTEILTAILFCFGDNAIATPKIDDITKLLEKQYGFQICNKYFINEDVTEVINRASEVDYQSNKEYRVNNHSYIYLDLYAIFKAMHGNVMELYHKWITPDVIKDIKGLQAE